MSSPFSYHHAFERNIGWITPDEQERLRRTRIAIAGMGGVGGSHLLTLVRLGIGAFSIADMDRFDIPNLNRQAGAMQSTLHRPKVEVLASLARDINPEVEIQSFPQGIGGHNVAEFLTGADLYVDGLDFFAFDAREAVFGHCAAAGIPAITVAPLGFSAALLNFLPGRMSFEQYFRLADCAVVEKAVRFLVGLAPRVLQRGYLANAGRVNLQAGEGPSTVIACQLCAGVAAAEALKILLKRGKVWSAPHGLQFDAYRNKLVHTWRPQGNAGWPNRLIIGLVKRQLGLRRRQ